MNAFAHSTQQRPVVGVFDSGFGGLTVLRELLQHLPGADFVYLGDTAHLPYGSKSQEAVTRFTAAAIRMLVAQGAQLVVIACNTASSLALPSLHGSAPVPLLGVIEPGAEAAADAVLAERTASLGGTVIVLATEATVASHAYAYACAANGLLALEKACPLFVPLVEEGWTDGSITEQIAAVYLREAFATAKSLPKAIVLGCTHYPLLRPLLEKVTKEMALDVPIVDAAEATARHAAAMLPYAAEPGGTTPMLRFYATDGAAKFQRLGPRFLQQPIASVEQISLDE